MRKIKYVILSILASMTILTGCSAKEYKIEEQKKEYVSIPDSSYTMAGQKLQTIDKSEYEKADQVFYVEDEKELARILEYNLNRGKVKTSFQAKRKLDMDKTANYLSYIEPYDISLMLSTTDYKDQKGKLFYQSNEVEVKNLDERYEETKLVAERIYADIISPSMDNDQKIKAIHDYLAATTIYNEISLEQSKQFPNVFKAAGALIDKDAVCAGYSRAFMMLAKLADVPAIYVASNAINHGWNLVYGNTGWRYIDVTWDDPVPDVYGRAEQKFLNMTIDEFLIEGSHIFDQDKQSEFYLNTAKMYFSKNETEFR